MRFQHERLPGGGRGNGQIRRRMRFFLHRQLQNERMLWLQLGKIFIVHVLWHARPRESAIAKREGFQPIQAAGLSEVRSSATSATFATFAAAATTATAAATRLHRDDCGH